MKATIHTTTRMQISDLDTASNPKAGGWHNHNETIVQDLETHADPKAGGIMVPERRGLICTNHNETVVADLSPSNNPKGGLSPADVDKIMSGIMHSSGGGSGAGGGAGAYAGGGGSGQQLIAHELTHTNQQRPNHNETLVKDLAAKADPKGGVTVRRAGERPQEY